MSRAFAMFGALALVGCGLVLDLDPRPPAPGELDAGPALTSDAGAGTIDAAPIDAGRADDAGDDAAIVMPDLDAGSPSCDPAMCPWGCGGVGCSLPAQLAVGLRHACVLTDTGAAFCWGDDGDGQVTGTPGSSVLRPARVLEADAPFVQLDAGGSHTCALAASGTLVCWGRNSEGQLGGTSTGIVRTRALADPGVEVRTGGRHTCMRTAAGEIWCWGASEQGQSGVLAARTARTRIMLAMDASATQLALGADFGCAATPGAVYCWGDNTRFQTGVNRVGPFATAQTTPLGAVAALALGARFGVLRDGGGQLRSWGDDSSLQLGDSGVDGTGYAARPVALGTAGAFGVGHAHGCADVGTRVVCWGANGAGQLGTGAPGSAVGVPTPSMFASDLVAIDGGEASTCVLTRAHAVWCTGANARGELGDGTTTGRAVPAMVLPEPGG